MGSLTKPGADKVCENCKICDILIEKARNQDITSLINDNEKYPICRLQANDFKKYLVRCLAEACYELKDKVYIKPTIMTDGVYEYDNHKYGADYTLEDVVLDPEKDILLIYGESGAGKSTFMNQLYQTACYYSIRHDLSVLPVYLQGSSFGQSDQKPSAWIESYLKKEYKHLNLLNAFYNTGTQVIIFIDAINDIEYNSYGDFQKKLDSWRSYIIESIGKYPKIKFIISSKYLDSLSDFEIRNHIKVRIKEWDNDKIVEYLNKKCDSEDKRREIITFIQNNDQDNDQNNDRNFMRLPFFINRIIDLPTSSIKNKTDVVRHFINEIIVRHTSTNLYFARRKQESYLCNEKYRDIKLHGELFLSVLSKIAFEKQSTETAIKQMVGNDYKQFIELAINCSILSEVLPSDISDKKYKFVHNILEDFFAARYIVSNIPEDKYDTFDLSDIISISDEARYGQVLQHVYNLLPNNRHFVDILLENNKLAFAAKCVLESDDIQQRNAVVEKIVGFLKEQGSINQESIDIGFNLGLLGDIRVDANIGISDKEYIEPVTVFIKEKSLYVGIFPVTNREYSYFIQDDGYKDQSNWIGDSKLWFDSDRKIQAICDYWLNIQKKINDNAESFYKLCREKKFDKKQIANLVYFKTISQSEIEAIIHDLYSDAKMFAPSWWDNLECNNPSQPVVGVSVYEALAYCEWLSKKTGKRYRLLTNDEWETAAHAKSITYSYGRDFDEKQCNTRESNLNRVIPVGICEKNKTSEGVYDLTGNVFEWTSSLYRKAEEKLVFKHYICKGGSWIQDKGRANSEYIGRGKGWVRNPDVGFRVCHE